MKRASPVFGRVPHLWCCAGFKDAYESAGERGFAVLIDPDETLGTRFTIQVRMVDQQDQRSLQSQLGTTAFPVSLVTETGMLFCPWCGVNLGRYYRKRAAGLARLGYSVSAL